MVNPHPVAVDVTANLAIESPGGAAVVYRAGPLVAQVPPLASALLADPAPWQGAEFPGVFEVWADVEARVPPSPAQTVRLQRSITAVSAGADTVAPLCKIAVPGRPLVLTSRDVRLRITGLDDQDPRERLCLFVRELAPSLPGGNWQVEQTYGWRPYTEELSWRLSDHPGAHVIQAWLLDEGGNLSLAATLWLNLAADPATLGACRYHAYHFELDEPGSLIVTVEPLSGDADLFAWIASATQEPTLAAEHGPGRTETIELRAPVPGVYTLAVLGQSECAYRWMSSFTAGTQSAAATAEQTGVAAQGACPAPDRPTIALPPAALPPAVAPGDLNADGRIDAYDLLFWRSTWLSRQPARGYRELADLARDGAITGEDLLELIDRWHRTTERCGCTAPTDQ